MILFIKHISIEGPETLGTFFMNRGFQVKELDLSQGDYLPQDLNGIEAVISLGGPMNVYEEDKYSFLKDDDVFIRKVIESSMPFMGLCLGSQLLAKAAGGKVVRSPNEEIGFSKVVLNQYGFKDPLFEGIDIEFDVYQWHGDMWELPPEAILLAGSEACPHQAFRVGKCAYGLQFHVEITENSIKSWSDTYMDMEKPSSLQRKEKMVKDYRKREESFCHLAEKLYNNFLNVVAANKQ